MTKCFCFGRRRNHRRLAAKSVKYDTPLELPPPVIGRVPTVVMTDDSVFRLATEGKNSDLRRVLSSSNDEDRIRRLGWTDYEGRSALVSAVKEGHFECMKTLLSFSADVNQVSYGRDEGTALHIAVKKRLPLKVVYALLSKSASPFLENHFHCTAWDFAQMYTNWPAINIFRNLGLFRKNLPIQVGSNPDRTYTRDVCIFPRYEWHTSSGLRRMSRTMHISSIGPSEEHSDFDLTGVKAEWIAEDMSTDIASILLTFAPAKVRLAKDLAKESKEDARVVPVWITKWAAWSLREFFNIVELTDYQNFMQSQEVGDRIAQWIGEQTTPKAFLVSDDFNISSALSDEVYKHAASGYSKELKYLLNGLSKSDKMRALCWEDYDHRTPLMIAVQKRHEKCAKLLLDHGANVHQSSRGQHSGTALHHAVTNKASKSMIKCLLSQSANPLVENYLRVTAADISGDNKELILHEKLLFNETINGSITLKGQFGSLGANKQFQILIAPRYACCDRPQDLCRISKTLHIYESDMNESLLEVDLFEANIEMLPERSEDYIDLLITFSSLSTLRWNATVKGKPESGSVVQLWISYRKVYKSFLDIVDIINAEAGMHIGRSVKNLWKAERPIQELSLSDKGTQASFQESSTSVEPLITPNDSSMSVHRHASKVSSKTKKVCMICLDNAVNCGLFHQDSVHECICHQCATELTHDGKGRCPYCRKTIDRIISLKSKE